MAAFKRQIRAGEKKLATYKAYRITLDEHTFRTLARAASPT